MAKGPEKNLAQCLKGGGGGVQGGGGGGGTHPPHPHPHLCRVALEGVGRGVRVRPSGGQRGPDLADHVLHGLPGNALLDVGVQVVVQEQGRGHKVVVVELVRHAPAQRPKLLALDEDRVHEAQDVQQLPPLLLVDGLQLVLRHPRVAPLEPRPDALRGLVRDLDRQLHRNAEGGPRQSPANTPLPPQPPAQRSTPDAM